MFIIQIIKVTKELSIPKTEAVTGVNHSEFARIRRVKLDRFTIDRLITILNRLNQRVEVDITLRPAQEEKRYSEVE